MYQRREFAMKYLATCLLALAATSAVAAPKPFYPATSAVTCATLKGNPLSTGGKVRFQAGQFGTIVLSCPLDVMAAINLGYTPYIDLIYRDSTGTGAGASVAARLVAIDMTTGARSASVLFVSDSLATAMLTRSRGPVPVYLLGSSNMIYTIEIALKRNKASQIVEVYGYELVP